MQASNAIALRVFSGPHIGAELQLPLGDHVLGYEDSCDIILVDASLLGRHAVVRVAEQGGADGQEDDATSRFAVSVTPLDGEIFVEGELVSPQGMALAPCTLFEVGTTSLAWNAVGASWSSMNVSSLTGHGFGAGGAVAEAGAENSDLGEPVGGDGSLAFYDDLGVGLDAVADGELAGDAELAQASEPLSLRRQAEKVAALPIKTLIAIFLAILCVCGVLVSFEGRAPDMVVHASELESTLHTMGMTGLTVTKTDDGIVVQGMLDSHEQRTKLWKVTSALLYPVQIDAIVREDLLLAVTAAFNSRHMYPEVISLPDIEPAAEGDNEVHIGTPHAEASIQISGYFQDGQVEAWAFQAMRKDVPSLFHAERNVRHEDEVKAVLEPALLEANLKHVRTRFMPGVVQVAGHFDLAQHEALDDALIAVQDQLGVPIRFEVYAVLPKSIQVAAATNTSDPRALKDAHKEAKKEADLASDDDEAQNPLGTLKVISVTLTPLCFFTTDDGQRFFEGAVLPSGYSVEKITMDALTLKKDGAEKVHNLRGNHD